METKVLQADSPEAISLAARLFHEGRLVGFPTETVYGLGANALNREAVLSIFAAKGRPADNPLIVHIWREEQMEGLCSVPEEARPLMEAFWPGPLTLLFERTSLVPDEVTAGLPTVAVRMPSMTCTRELLKACDLPIAAPSANLSGRPSPTTAAHVLEDMNGKVPLILDGGPCQVGLESTVLDLTHGQPTILRPGGITREMIEETLHQEVALAGSILRPLKPDEQALSPGMRYRHYAPEGAVTLVEGQEANVLRVMRERCLQDRAAGKKSCVLCFTEHRDALEDCDPHVIGSREDSRETAHLLFDTLRTLDQEQMETIYSEVLPPDGVGLAVMNRLGRAAAFHAIQA